MFVIALAFLNAPASAQVHVRDGDTIVVNGTPIRLAGIDAPELGTQTGRDARRWMANYLNGEPTHDR